MIPTELPFYYKTHDKKGNGIFPESLRIDICFDEEYRMYRQKASTDLQNYLNEVYEEGSLVDGSISNESGIVYVKAVSKFILDTLPEKPNSNVLEIGCGSGIILKELKNYNNNIKLLGIEPGKHSKVENLGDIEIINDFFPSKYISGKFDLIYSLLVLEHFENPVEFLLNQKDFLSENGKIVFGVPNCEPFLNTGDISIFIHEHYSYFTTESIIKLAELANLCVEKIEVVEGMFLAVLNNSGFENSIKLQNGKIDYRDFETNISNLNKKVLGLISKYDEDKVAIYVPGRALGTLFTINKVRCRLVDDNSELRKKYLPTLTKPIESFSDILDNPPQCILIYSRTFGEKIKQKCLKESNLQSTLVLTLNDL